MKPIRVKAPFEDGYVEVCYLNDRYAFWQCFRPDPRKKQMRRAKYWPREACYGEPQYLTEVHHTPKPLLELVGKLLFEAIRRYDQRYAVFGELGNAQMPPDPDHEAMWEALIATVLPDIKKLVNDTDAMWKRIHGSTGSTSD